MDLPGKKPRLIIIQGPTASGKSSLAIALARKIGGEIISADSMQVYRHMDIGAAKPTRAQQEEVIHHLIDVAAPDDPFDAGRYVKAASEIISRLQESDTPILVVGGTGLYIKALLGGLSPSPAADENLRERYRREAELFGRHYLHHQLQVKDPLAAAGIHERDQARIIRALEVFEATGRSIRESQERHRFGANRYEYLKLGITRDRKDLYRLIDRRVESMIDAGLAAEVEGLLARGYSPRLKPMQSLGYRHMVNYLEGNWRLEEAVELMKRDTRHYAKRQLTWFGRDGEIKWFAPEEGETMEKEIRKFLFIEEGLA